LVISNNYSNLKPVIGIIKQDQSEIQHINSDPDQSLEDNIDQSTVGPGISKDTNRVPL
jgi:hypothetical protein